MYTVLIWINIILIHTHAAISTVLVISCSSTIYSTIFLDQNISYQVTEQKNINSEYFQTEK